LARDSAKKKKKASGEFAGNERVAGVSHIAKVQQGQATHAG
jgi:hypothetical protein